MADRMRRAIMNAAGLTGLDWLARPLLGGVGAILMLHRVTARPLAYPDGPNRHLAVHPDFLDRTLTLMHRDGFRFVSMDEAVRRLETGTGSGRFAVVSADDGYRDNLCEALPVLERHEAPFIVYVAPGLTDCETALWWDALEDIAFTGATLNLPNGERLDPSQTGERAVFSRLVRLLTEEVAEEDQAGALAALAAQAGTDPMRANKDLMSWDEVRALARHPLATVGAHTVHHANLKRLGVETAGRELRESRERLERELGEAPRHLAFPYGFAAAVGAREVALAQEAGFASAVTTRHGVLQRGHAGHLHALPRVSLNGRFQDARQARVMLRGFTAPLANRGRRLVTV